MGLEGVTEVMGSAVMAEDIGSEVEMEYMRRRWPRIWGLRLGFGP